MSLLDWALLATAAALAVNPILGLVRFLQSLVK